jgi:hypothetical protein
MQKPGDLPERRLQLENASRKGVQAAVGILFSEKIPSPACRIRVAERSAGFCFFSSIKGSPLCAPSAPSASLL